MAHAKEGHLRRRNRLPTTRRAFGRESVTAIQSVALDESRAVKGSLSALGGSGVPANPWDGLERAGKT